MRGPLEIPLIDYIMTPFELEDNILDCNVLEDTELNTSDHRLVQVTINIAHIKNCQKGMVNFNTKR